MVVRYLGVPSTKTKFSAGLVPHQSLTGYSITVVRYLGVVVAWVQLPVPRKKTFGAGVATRVQLPALRKLYESIMNQYESKRY